MIDPRRRALAALAGGAYVPTDEVDAEQVPADAVPDVPEPLPSPDSEEVARGKPVVGEVHAAPDEYAQALQQSHERAFQESLAGVGSGIIKAFTGVGRDGDDEARRNFINEPIAQYLQRQKEADAALKQQHAVRPPAAGRPQKSTDPNSPESKRAQSVIRATLGDQYTEDEIAQMSEADADSVMKYGSMKRGAEVTREGHVGADKRASATLEQRTKEHIEEMGFKWENLSHQDQRAYMALEEARIYRDQARADRQQEQLDNDVTNLGKDLEDVGAMRDDLMTLRSGAFKSDIPGVGLIDARKPGFMQGPADVAVRQAVRGIVSRLLKAQSGSTVSEQELDRKLEELGMGDSATEQQFRSGLARLERDVTNTLTSREARHKPEAVKTYKGRGGITSGDMPPPGPTRKPAANILPKDSTGQPTLDAPADTVRIILNGKPKDVPRANLEKVKALAKQKGYTLEVPNG